MQNEVLGAVRQERYEITICVYSSIVPKVRSCVRQFLAALNYQLKASRRMVAKTVRTAL
jgi:hypothetical protein